MSAFEGGIAEVASRGVDGIARFEQRSDRSYQLRTTSEKIPQTGEFNNVRDMPGGRPDFRF
jgi:hypothetical protein